MLLAFFASLFVMVVSGDSNITFFPPSDPAFYYSPYQWNVLGLNATTVNTGAYIRVLFTGSQPSVLFDTNTMCDTPSQVYTRIDNGPLVMSVLTPYKGVSASGPNGTITVQEATYGANCNASLAGDMNALAQAACNGKDPCNFPVCNCNNMGEGCGGQPCIPDPASECEKDFTVVWRCTADAPTYTRTLHLPGPAENHAVNLTCGPPPPPPPPPPALQLNLTIPPDNTAGDLPYHTLEIIVKSTTEQANRWQNDSVIATSVRVMFRGLLLAPPPPPTLGRTGKKGGKVAAVAAAAAAAPSLPALAPWLPSTLNLLMYGDSITEGVRTQGDKEALDTDRNDATQSWGYALGRLMGAETGVVGFGATGASKGGSGGVPAINFSYSYLWNNVPRVFVPQPDMVIFNEGTNDANTNITGPMVQVINGLQAINPGTPIVLLLPFDGAQAGNLKMACELAANPALCFFVDTAGVCNATFGIDNLGLHPTGPNDVARIAPQLAAKLRPILHASLVDRARAKGGV